MSRKNQTPHSNLRDSSSEVELQKLRLAALQSLANSTQRLEREDGEISSDDTKESKIRKNEDDFKFLMMQYEKSQVSLENSSSAQPVQTTLLNKASIISPTINPDPKKVISIPGLATSSPLSSFSSNPSKDASIPPRWRPLQPLGGTGSPISKSPKPSFSSPPKSTPFFKSYFSAANPNSISDHEPRSLAKKSRRKPKKLKSPLFLKEDIVSSHMTAASLSSLSLQKDSASPQPQTVDSTPPSSKYFSGHSPIFPQNSMSQPKKASGYFYKSDLPQDSYLLSRSLPASFRRSAFLQPRPTNLVIHLSDTEDYCDSSIYEAHAQTVGEPLYKKYVSANVTPPGIGNVSGKIPVEDYQRKLEEIAKMREKIAEMERKASYKQDTCSGSEIALASPTPPSGVSENKKDNLSAHSPCSDSTQLDIINMSHQASVSASLGILTDEVNLTKSSRMKATPSSVVNRQMLRQKITSTETLLNEIQKLLLQEENTLEELENSLDSFQEKRELTKGKIEQLKAQILLEEKNLDIIDDEEEKVGDEIERARGQILQKSEQGIQLQIQISKLREELFSSFGRRLSKRKESISSTPIPGIQNSKKKIPSPINEKSNQTEEIVNHHHPLKDIENSSLKESLPDFKDSLDDDLYCNSNNQKKENTEPRACSPSNSSDDEAMDISSGSCPSENSEGEQDIENGSPVLKRKPEDELSISDLSQVDTDQTNALEVVNPSSPSEDLYISHKRQKIEDIENGKQQDVVVSKTSKELAELMKRMEKVRQEQSNVFALLSERNQQATDAAKTEVLKSNAPFIVTYLSSPPSKFVVHEEIASQNSDANNGIVKEPCLISLGTSAPTLSLLYDVQTSLISMENDIFCPSQLPLGSSSAIDASKWESAILSLIEFQNGPENKPKLCTTSFTKEDRKRFENYSSPLTHFKDHRIFDSIKNTKVEDLDFIRQLISDSLNKDRKLVCVYESRGGVCRDSSCKFQHFRNFEITDDQIVEYLLSYRIGSTSEEHEKYCNQLKQRLKDFISSKSVDLLQKSFPTFFIELIQDVVNFYSQLQNQGISISAVRSSKMSKQPAKLHRNLDGPENIQDKMDSFAPCSAVMIEGLLEAINGESMKSARYFDIVHTDEEFEELCAKNPNEPNLWFNYALKMMPALSRGTFYKPIFSKMEGTQNVKLKGLDKPLNILARGIQKNRNSTILWHLYIELYVKRASDKDIRDIFNTAIPLLPSCPRFWWRYYQWEPIFEKRLEFLVKLYSHFDTVQSIEDSFSRSQILVDALVQILYSFLNNSDDPKNINLCSRNWLLHNLISTKSGLDMTILKDTDVDFTYLKTAQICDIKDTYLSSRLHSHHLLILWLILIHHLWFGSPPETVSFDYPQQFITRSDLFLISWSKIGSVPSSDTCRIVKAILESLLRHYQSLLSDKEDNTNTDIELLHCFLAITKNYFYFIRNLLERYPDIAFGLSINFSGIKDILQSLRKSFPNIIQLWDLQVELSMEFHEGVQTELLFRTCLLETNYHPQLFNRYISHLCQQGRQDSVHDLFQHYVLRYFSDDERILSKLNGDKFHKVVTLFRCVLGIPSSNDRDYDISDPAPSTLQLINGKSLRHSLYFWLNYLAYLILATQQGSDFDIMEDFKEAFKNIKFSHERMVLWKELANFYKLSKGESKHHDDVVSTIVYKASQDLAISVRNPYSERSISHAEYIRLPVIHDTLLLDKFTTFIFDFMPNFTSFDKVKQLSSSDILCVELSIRHALYEYNQGNIGKGRMVFLKLITSFPCCSYIFTSFINCESTLSSSLSKQLLLLMSHIPQFPRSTYLKCQRLVDGSKSG